MQARSPREATPDNYSMEIYIVIAIALVIIVIGTYLYNSNGKSSQPPAPQQLPIIAQTVPVASTVADSEGETQLSTSGNDSAKNEQTSIAVNSITAKSITTSNIDADSETDNEAATLLRDKAKNEVLEPELTTAQPLEPAAVPLPNLDSSDPIALTTAQQLSWLPAYATLLINEDLIRNFVVFIDNLSRGDLFRNNIFFSITNKNVAFFQGVRI